MVNRQPPLFIFLTTCNGDHAAALDGCITRRDLVSYQAIRSESHVSLDMCLEDAQFGFVSQILYTPFGVHPWFFPSQSN